jgi:hypothetical protein
MAREDVDGSLGDRGERLDALLQALGKEVVAPGTLAVRVERALRVSPSECPPVRQKSGNLRHILPRFQDNP